MAELVVIPGASASHALGHSVDRDRALDDAARREVIEHVLAGGALDEAVGAVTHDRLREPQPELDLCGVGAIVQLKAVLAVPDPFDAAAVIVE